MTICVLLLLSLCAFPLLGACVWIIAFLQIGAFLRAHTSIDNPQQFDALKRVIKADMYLALTLLGLGAAMLILWGVGLWLGCNGMLAFACVMLVYGPIALVLGLLKQKAERRLRELPVTDPSLQAEHERIIKRWKKSPLPDW